MTALREPDETIRCVQLILCVFPQKQAPLGCVEFTPKKVCVMFAALGHTVLDTFASQEVSLIGMELSAKLDQSNVWGGDFTDTCAKH